MPQDERYRVMIIFHDAEMFDSDVFHIISSRRSILGPAAVLFEMSRDRSTQTREGRHDYFAFGRIRAARNFRLTPRFSKR